MHFIVDLTAHIKSILVHLIPLLFFFIFVLIIYLIGVILCILAIFRLIILCNDEIDLRTLTLALHVINFFHFIYIDLLLIIIIVILGFDVEELLFETLLSWYLVISNCIPASIILLVLFVFDGDLVIHFML